ncbi:MAG: hypothetical protein LBS45_00150 [Synergistaceae bacterium]|jgi:hypothetical protein|nr:hypothetical protein [Synergistaceae bacterium]
MQELIDRVNEWRSDAVKFVREMLGAEPSPQQLELLRAVSAPGAHIAAKSGHGTGKSTTLSWLILWGVCCWRDVKIPCTAPTKHQLEDVLWTEVKKWQARMIEPWKSSIKITVDKVVLNSSPGYAVARTGRKENPEALQGFHADELFFVIDEASGIDDAVFEVAQGALSTPSSRVIMTSNPTRTTGFFYRAFHSQRENWKKFTFSCVDSPFVAHEYIEQMESEYGRDSDIFRVRVLGDFPSGGDLQFIKIKDVEDAIARDYGIEVFGRAPVVLGVDVAWYGGDRNVIVLRQGLYAYVLWTRRECEIAVLSGIVDDLWRKHDAQAVYIDSTGVGAGVVSNLRMMGRNPFAVSFGGGSSDPQYKNKRAECWGKMRDWLTAENGWLQAGQYAEQFKDDLTGPDYCFDLQGRLQLERKEEMRKRGVASPDFADALAVTFAFPITMNHPRRDETTMENYDPFKLRKRRR